MPLDQVRRRGQGSTPAPTSGGGSLSAVRRRGQPVPEVVEPDEILPPEEEEKTGPGVGTAAAVGGAALLAAVLKNPQAAKQIAGKGADYLNALRMTSMLSGLAPLKSALGNVGGVMNMAVERRSMEPLKQFFSKQTVKDFASEFRNPTSEISKATAEGARVGNPIGRFMGAGDTATQRAMQRAGATPEESAAQLLQTPLPPQVAEALSSRGAQWLVPFRRTPINQALEAARMLKPGYGDPVLMASHAVAGAGTGAATEDQRFPVMPALYSALAGRYAGPAVLGALTGRALAGGKDQGGLVGNLLPVSEYGVSQSLAEPLAPFTQPAGLRALKRIRGED